MKKVKNTQKDLNKIKFKNFMKNNMSFISFIAILLLITLAITFNHLKTNIITEKPTLVYGDDVIEMNYFYLITCPHCKEQEKFHSTLINKYPNLKINEYEMTNPNSRKIYMEYANKTTMENPENIATPTTIIGNEYNIGFSTEETTGKIILDMIEKENEKIKANWNNTTMKTTVELRNSNLE